MKKREIVVYEDCHQTKENYRGTFHQFGCDYREFEAGPALFTTAIIERDNGRLRGERVDVCRFVAEEDDE